LAGHKEFERNRIIFYIKRGEWKMPMRKGGGTLTLGLPKSSSVNKQKPLPYCERKGTEGRKGQKPFPPNSPFSLTHKKSNFYIKKPSNSFF
jgi:hypothetical protein